MELKRQPGDVCFPGGSREGGETPLDTALRETWEETGIPAENIEILGQTDFVVAPYGAVITPFVGLIKNMTVNDLKLNPDEVAEVFTVPVKFFTDTEPEAHYITISHEIPEDFPFEYIVGGKKLSLEQGTSAGVLLFLRKSHYMGLYRKNSAEFMSYTERRNLKWLTK